MIDDPSSAPVPYDPSSMVGNATQKAVKLVWYKRPWVLVTLGVVVIVAASVAVDLPRHTTVAEDVSDETSLMNQINGDIGGCAYAIQETFTIYQDLKAGSLTSADRSRTPKLLRDDQTACSFTSSAIYDLTNNIQTSGTTAGRSIGQALDVATLWTTSDALAAIEDIQTIYGGTATAATVADLSHQERLLAADRAKAEIDVQAAEATLHAHLPAPNLPTLPHLTGTS
jgi:hypothetical protein